MSIAATPVVTVHGHRPAGHAPQALPARPGKPGRGFRPQHSGARLHALKVSRGDLQRELTDLTKSDPWQRYCDRWWLVIPGLSLIQGLELPESWGVMLSPAGRRTLIVHRPAPALRPVEQALALRALVAWQHWRLRDAHVAQTNVLRERSES